MHKYTFKKAVTLSEKLEKFVLYTWPGKVTAAVLITLALYAYIIIFWAMFEGAK